MEWFRRHKEVAFALLIYSAMALVITWPSALHPTDRVIGGSGTDVWKHLWGYWRTEKAFFEDHEFPYQVRRFNFPYGGTLYHVDLLNSLFMIPLKFLFGSIPGYNILVLAHVIAGALAMFMLAQRLVERFSPSILAGVIYAFCPYVTTFSMASGITERLNIAWMPLFVLFVLKILAKGRVRDFCLAGLMFFLAALGCWKYALFTYILTFFFSLYLIGSSVAHKIFRSFSGDPRLSPEYTLRSLILKKLLPLAFVCALAAAPISMAAAVSTRGSGALMKRESTASMFWKGDKPIASILLFTLSDYLVPGRTHLRITQFYDVIYQVIYIGWGVMFTGFISVRSSRRYAAFFFPAGAVFMILSVGPMFQVTAYGPMHVSPIYMFAARTIPYLQSLEASWELSFPGVMCFAVAAAFGLDVLLARLKGNVRGPAALAIIAAISVEQFVVSPAVIPTPNSKVNVPAFHQKLAAEKEDYAVFDYPDRKPESELLVSEYLFYQTIHQKSIPYSVNTSWIFSNPFWYGLTEFQAGKSDLITATPDQAGAAREFLASHGYRYFILHKSLLTIEKYPVFVSFFNAMFGAPMREDGDVIVYSIEKNKTTDTNP